MKSHRPTHTGLSEQAFVHAASREIARKNPRSPPMIVAFVKWELSKAAMFKSLQETMAVQPMPEGLLERFI